MLIAVAQAWSGSVSEELPLNQVSDFPLLEGCWRRWRDAAAAGAMPARLDPVELPRRVLPMLLLLDLEPAPARLRVRLAGTGICERHGGELRGRTADQLFDAEDARLLAEAGLGVAATGRPSLAHRSCVTFGERLWSYTRLLLPLARGGGAVDGVCKVIDPASLRRIG